MSITNESELRTVYGAPNKRSQQKVLGHLDQHCRRFIALSPFCVLSTAGAGGRVDVSPRGDVPGFVAVPDDRTLLIPDRPGNNQIDSLRNVVEQPHVGLLFLVPGMNETLRVKGTAEIVTDEDLLATLSVKGRSPVSILRVTVAEAFLHCAKALIRARFLGPPRRRSSAAASQPTGRCSRTRSGERMPRTSTPPWTKRLETGSIERRAPNPEVVAFSAGC